ncbi:hypothetical protein [Vibrio cyclitrophicus]|uniref:hypothetical protein n=1 Tax=Vibrio cyclitrophicus TaxID=47951 RepID=UPI00030D3D9D|nr:hypothetical protein [Vibrio cyclitrophicus]OCH46129.1 hypothetical protein A6D96_22960 [Vibrio cyclitrophicus]
MSDFTAIGQYVTEARTLLDSIKGGAIRTMQTQFDALKVAFSDKTIELSQSMTDFVYQQKSKVNEIFADPDSRYASVSAQTINVGGNWDTFYPVCIHGDAAFMRTLQITRGYAHSDRGNINGLAPDVSPGSLMFVVRFVMSAFGNNTPVTSIDVNNGNFVGKVENYYKSSYLIVWLRGGGVTYNLFMDRGLEPLPTIFELKPMEGNGIYEQGFTAWERDFLPISEVDPNLFKGVS